jgi:hypothetical protein
MSPEMEPEKAPRPPRPRRRPAKPRFGLRHSLIAAAVLVFLAFALTLIWTQKRSPCGESIAYNNTQYDFKAASELLNLTFASKNEAVAGMSECLRIYLDQAKHLCEEHRTGGLTDDSYARRVNDLGARFGILVALQQRNPAEGVGPATLPFFKEMLEALREQDLEPAEFEYRVIAQHGPLTSNSVLRSGDEFHLQIELSKTMYVYVLMLNSRGALMRLYPGDLTGNENPARGHLRIPADPTKNFTLDDQTGTERILLFTQTTPSRAIEQRIRAVENRPATLEPADEELRRAVGLRGVFVKSSDQAGRMLVESRIGQPAAEFLIDHR